VRLLRPQGVRHDPHRLAASLWTAHHHDLVTPVDPLYLDAEKPEDRKLWAKQQNKNMWSEETSPRPPLASRGTLRDGEGRN